MSKSELTKKIEKNLIHTYLNKNANRIGVEISCSTGFVDFVTAKYKYIKEKQRREFVTTCYEIKISKADLFKSNHGHNFVGNYNYYIIPKSLYDSLTPEELSISNNGLWGCNIGREDIGIKVYYDNGYIRTKKPAKERDMSTFSPYTNEHCNTVLIDGILLAWQTGSMQKILEKHEIVLPNAIKFCDDCKKESLNLYETRSYTKLCNKCYRDYLIRGKDNARI